MEWKTKVTELLGCKYPILEGAYGGQGDWRFAAAVANTGAHGLITAGTSRTPERLREDIKRCQDATNGTFGVNLTLTGSLPVEEMLEVCIEEGVPVETAAYKPDAVAARIKESGLPWIHKTARMKDAIHAERLGVDAVIVVGLEGTGFKSAEQLPTMITTIWAKREVKIPFIAAGGIGDARGFLGALAMGADGVMMGTAFMATKEFSVSNALKERLVRTPPDDSRIRHLILDSPDPKDLEAVMKMRDKMPLGEWLPMLERVNLKDPDWRKPARAPGRSSGEGAGGLSLLGSLAVGVIDSVPTVKEFVDNIIREAEELLDSYEFLKTR